MALTVTTPAVSRRLTRKERVKAELGLADATHDALLEELIDQASDSIRSYCRRPFEREVVSETVAGYGNLELPLSRTPIVAVTSVVYAGEVITDYVVNAEEGFLYRQAGWGWTVQAAPGLSGWQRFPGPGVPLPRHEEPQFTVAYVNGYVLPEQNILDVATLSADAGDNSFNDSGNRITTLLRAGDVIEVRGFTAAANNGRHVVAATPTAGKVKVNSSLTTEAAGGTRSLILQSLPRDVEKACIESVKAWHLGRSDNPNVAEKQVGSLRVRFGEAGGTIFTDYIPLPASAIGLLQRWVRYA